MGDGSSIVQNRANFDEIVSRGANVVRFSAHLAYRLLGRFDAALGSTADSPVEAYRMLSWLAGAVFAVTLWFWRRLIGGVPARFDTSRSP
jgi:hypothetical protein